MICMEQGVPHLGFSAFFISISFTPHKAYCFCYVLNAHQGGGHLKTLKYDKKREF